MNGEVLKLWSFGSEDAYLGKFIVFSAIVLTLITLIIIFTILVRKLVIKECEWHTGLIIASVVIMISSLTCIDTVKQNIKDNREINIYVYSVENYLKNKPFEDEMKLFKADDTYVIMCKDVNLKDLEVYTNSSVSRILEIALENEK